METASMKGNIARTATVTVTEKTAGAMKSQKPAKVEGTPPKPAGKSK